MNQSMQDKPVLLSLKQLSRRFGGGKTLLGKPLPQVHAVQQIDLEVYKGETLGIVGESGCGKSTLARMIVALDTPSDGEIIFDGDSIVNLSNKQARRLARRIQYVFQDPVSSLNPRKTIRQILETPLSHLLDMKAPERREKLDSLMDAVSLRRSFLERYPHEFSGGQAQRIGIARTLAVNPDLLVLDEPVSALDVSVQAQVINLLADLKRQFSLTYIFISHDLAVVENVSDRVAVMYFGSIVEIAPVQGLFEKPAHPYTRLLLDSIPAPGKSIQDQQVMAELPDPYNPPPGCAFAPRCPKAQSNCHKQMPPLEALNVHRKARCFYPLHNSE